jgi:putative inorganic carbon (HCO3(-)) transporter
MGFVAFCLYTFALLVRPQDWWLPLQNAPVVTIFLLAATVAAIFYRNKNLSYPQFYLAIFFILHVVLSSIANGWAGGGLIKGEKLLSGLFLPIFCGAILIDSQAKREKIFKLMIYAALFMVFNGVTQRMAEDGFGFVGSKTSKKDDRITYVGILNDPNDLGMYFVMILPIIAYFALQFAGFKRYLYVLYGMIVFLGIYLTNSRGTLLGVITLLGVWHWFNQGMKKTLLRSALALPVLFLVMSKFRAIDAEEESAVGRLDAWYEGMQMFLANPIFGIGQGDFIEHHNLTAHNSFVLVFSELGFPGYFIWIAILYLTIFPLWKLFVVKNTMDFEKNDHVESVVNAHFPVIQHGQLLFYSMVGYLATAFFLSRSYTPLLYLFIGICLSCLEELRQSGYILEVETLKKNLVPIFGLCVASIAAVWLVTKLFL